MLSPRLGVNIDHVATVRQARGELYPETVRAAEIALDAGADQITIHLREDRRHIQDYDLSLVKSVTDRFNRPLNLEIGTDYEIAKIATGLMPDWVCIVPEKREERTTEGGLNLLDKMFYSKTLDICRLLKEESPKTKISLFVEANDDIFQTIDSMREFVDAVEIHTGEFAKDFVEKKSTQKHLAQFRKIKERATEMGVGYHAGHGLTDLSVVPLLEERLFSEYNIGHWIVSEAIFEGLGEVVTRLKKLFQSI